MTQTTTRKLTVEEVLDKVGFDRTFNYLFDKLGTAGILEKMAEEEERRRDELTGGGRARASRMHQILLDAAKRARLV